ncbi:MAG: alpha/beta hydrolase [Hyphomicrobiales bacterium]
MNAHPETFRFDFAEVNGISLHYAACGDRQAPLILFLHGFPEYWAAWADVMPYFAQSHFCVAPDQRGFNLSSKPERESDYATRHAVEDAFQLTERLSPGRPFVLAGHDWGASVAYAFAMRHPDRVSRLVIANGVHPGTFQAALLTDPEQIAASQYFHLLCNPKAEEVLSRDDYARLMNMLEGFSATPFLTDEARAQYRDAWRRPGALTAMLNWYRASPIYVPEAGASPDPEKALKIDPDQLRIAMPHILIHGLEDQALRPSSFAGIEAYAPQVEVHRVEGAGHWILHERPGLVAETMKDWLERWPISSDPAHGP